MQEKLQELQAKLAHEESEKSDLLKRVEEVQSLSKEKDNLEKVIFVS
jgi:uncharacterized protein YaaR (DUF327 family)